MRAELLVVTVLAGCAVAARIALARRAGQPARLSDPVRQLPLAADLLASCLAVGAAPGQAADAVAESLPPPMSALLGTAAAELRLGADASACWSRFGRQRGLAPLGRCLQRAGETGVPPVEAVSRLADEQRAAENRAALASARRVGVLVTAPLGGCFLPAFLLVGVAPVVLGLAQTLLARM